MLRATTRDPLTRIVVIAMITGYFLWRIDRFFDRFLPDNKQENVQVQIASLPSAPIQILFSEQDLDKRLLHHYQRDILALRLSRTMLAMELRLTQLEERLLETSYGSDTSKA